MSEDLPAVRKLAQDRRLKIRELLLTWGTKNFRSFPWRVDRAPYKILVAETLLRRTTAKAASRVYSTFLESYPDIYALADARTEDLEYILCSVGLQRKRAAILKQVGCFIVERYSGEIPNEMDVLLGIPHVGRYAAGAVLSFGYGVPAAIVDSNMCRILGRMFARSNHERLPDEVLSEIAELLLPEDRHEAFNFGLLDLGGLVCKYDKSRCKCCPLTSTCDTARGLSTVPL